MDRACSQGLCFLEDACPAPIRQRVRGQDVHLHAQQGAQLLADRTDVEQSCLVRGLNKQIEVAAFSIVAPHRRAEHPDVTHAVVQRNLTDTIAMEMEGFGRAHGLIVRNGEERRNWRVGTTARVSPAPVWTSQAPPCHSTAKKWQVLPPSTNRCQTKCA